MENKTAAILAISLGLIPLYLFIIGYINVLLSGGVGIFIASFILYPVLILLVIVVPEIISMIFGLQLLKIQQYKTLSIITIIFNAIFLCIFLYLSISLIINPFHFDNLGAFP